ncbi:amino acid adenylation domain-containing protein [Plantactinospora sp. KBS50]|uniref:amino acid adenylation domain-containing protein n=1 Tax=Plantactinospora sp. KBS50 TaxID=2024580 RepID=UPI0018E00D8F|nr:amino acid adenylation domain-containing protein [Plantactinospora sp. KBS50]
MRDGPPPEPVIHVAVDRHAAARPDAPALIEAGVRGPGAPVSYRVLVGAARAYAEQLSRRGVRPGQVVPLLLPRSPQLVAVELAVLMCGAAYANLDVRWPAERHAAIIEMIGPELVVTRDAAAPGGADALRLPPEDLSDVADRADGFVPATVDGSAPATVFFTSGTTGQPKGVVVPHRAVTRLFGPDRVPGFGPGRAMPQAAPPAWDMYGFEAWGPLTSGGCSVIVPEDHLMPGRLSELVRTAGVNRLWLTSSLVNLFVDEDPDCFRGLGAVLTGGERLSPKHIGAFLAAHPQIPLWNGYGPAENCMLTTAHRVGPADCELAGGVPVGRPVPGSDVLVLDENGQRCPAGAPGEICIAGTGLALGYLGQPELTAQKFPTVQVDGVPVRIYRTGDVGIVDESGVLHFRGRRDRQIKIAGHRIELGEVEVGARRLDGVRECVALPLAGDDGSVARLALLYTTDAADAAAGPVAAGNGPDPVGVRAALAARLPAYLVPDVVRMLDQFPVTANGKVDRAALESLARRPGRAARRPAR